MLSVLGQALRDFLSWFETIFFAFIGEYTVDRGGTVITYNYYQSPGFRQLMPFFALGLAASIIMFCAKILRKMKSRF